LRSSSLTYSLTSRAHIALCVSPTYIPIRTQKVRSNVHRHPPRSPIHSSSKPKQTPEDAHDYPKHSRSPPSNPSTSSSHAYRVSLIYPARSEQPHVRLQRVPTPHQRTVSVHVQQSLARRRNHRRHALRMPTPHRARLRRSEDRREGKVRGLVSRVGDWVRRRVCVQHWGPARERRHRQKLGIVEYWLSNPVAGLA
jgi:hypothetical protein